MTREQTTHSKINLSTSEAAHYLRIAKSELAAARCSGSLRGLTPPRFIRVGRTVLYPVCELDQWNKSQQLFTTNAEAESSLNCAGISL